VHSLEVLSWEHDCFDLRVACSKGTYIRSLAADIGERLGCGAHLAGLRRTRIGQLRLEQAVQLVAIEAAMVDQRLGYLKPTDFLSLDLPRADLGEDDSGRMRHGQSIRWLGEGGSRWRLYGSDGRFLGVGVMEDGWLQPKRLVTNGEAVVT